MILCVGDPAGDPRPRRVIDSLGDSGHEVDVIVPRPPARAFRRLRTALGMLSPWRERAIGARFGYQPLERAYDLIVVEDIYLLPLAIRNRRGARVIMDAREYYPRVHESSIVFRLFQRRELTWLCREFLPLCDAVVTVSDGLAAEYRREFGIECEVIRSIPPYQSLDARPVRDGRIRMVHHGVANRDRRIERMIDITIGLDERFSLDLYLTGDPAYIAELASRAGPVSRIRVRPAIPFERICASLNEYDVGLFYVEPATFNLKHCLPNKLFEFIQARLAVAIGPSPDMAALVTQYGCGVVADAFSERSMIAALSALTPESVMRHKHASAAAAETLCWEIEQVRGAKLLAGTAA